MSLNGSWRHGVPVGEDHFPSEKAFHSNKLQVVVPELLVIGPLDVEVNPLRVEHGQQIELAELVPFPCPLQQVLCSLILAFRKGSDSSLRRFEAVPGRFRGPFQVELSPELHLLPVAQAGTSYFSIGAA